MFHFIKNVAEVIGAWVLRKNGTRLKLSNYIFSLDHGINCSPSVWSCSILSTCGFSRCWAHKNRKFITWFLWNNALHVLNVVSNCTRGSIFDWQCRLRGSLCKSTSLRICSSEAKLNRKSLEQGDMKPCTASIHCLRDARNAFSTRGRITLICPLLLFPLRILHSSWKPFEPHSSSVSRMTGPF